MSTKPLPNMNPIDTLQQKDSAEQTTDTDATPVCDGGRVDTDTAGENEGDDSGETADDGDSDDDSNDSSDDDEDDLRRANVSHTADGQPIGAAVWINADELADLGVDVDAADAVAYRVEGSDFHVDTVGESGE